jgi:hypothetical protein
LVSFVGAVDVDALGQKRAQAVDIAERGSTEEFKSDDAHEPG